MNMAEAEGDGIERDSLADDDPLWCVNEQIKDLMEGIGADEDHESVIAFLLSTGLPAGTVSRIHSVLVCGEVASPGEVCASCGDRYFDVGIRPGAMCGECWPAVSKIEAEAAGSEQSFSAGEFMEWLNSPESREDHRREYTDLQWASIQPRGDPKFKIGDVVQFHVGGFGVIRKVSWPQGGWPSSYATEEVDGTQPHKTGKSAWHYEGDFKAWIAKSALHSLQSNQSVAEA